MYMLSFILSVAPQQNQQIVLENIETPESFMSKQSIQFLHPMC
jgi:hypothetical protein